MTNPKTESNIIELLSSENPTGLFYLKNDSIQYANAAFVKAFTGNNECVVGKSIYKYIQESDYSLLAQKIKQLKKEKIDSCFDIHIQLKNNNTATQNVYCSLNIKIVNIKGDDIELVGTAIDVTNRINQFNQLVISHSNFKALFKNSKQGIVIYNYESEKIIEVNNAALKELGYENDAQSFLQLNRLDFVPKTSTFYPGIDNHKEISNHGERVKNGESFYVPGMLRKKDGDIILVDIHVVPTLQNYGEAFVIFNNITEKFLAKKAAISSQQKYRNIFENSHEGILYYSLKKRRVEICNKNALNILGINSLENLNALEAKDFYYNKKIKDIKYTQFTIHTLKKALRNGRTEVTFKLKQQTGRVIWVTTVLISDKTNPKKPYIIIFIRNITELYEAQQLLNQKNIELQKYIDSNLQLENFAYLASHDLQTPLRSIISFTQLLQSKLKGKLSKEESEYMNFIISSSKNMKELVNDLLAYSSVNETQIKLKEIDVFKCLNELLIELNEIIKENKATINLENINQTINADYIKIRQIFQNLIINAIKFTTKGDKPLITITGLESETEWIFSVSDKGIGIEKVYKDKIFLLFKRLHNSEYEGTGIGLALVKKIIEQHQGKIWFESELGKGTTFYFSIPKYELTPSNKREQNLAIALLN